MSETKSYPGFLTDMGELLKSAMPRTDRERDDLADAEADFRRIKSNLGVARKRRDLARTRYERERSVLMGLYETWKAEVMSLPTVDDDGETPVREIPEASDD